MPENIKNTYEENQKIQDDFAGAKVINLGDFIKLILNQGKKTSSIENPEKSKNLKEKIHDQIKEPEKTPDPPQETQASFKPIKYTSFKCYAWSLKTWNYLVLSLPLDLLIFLNPVHFGFDTKLFDLIIICFLTTSGLIFLDRKNLISKYLRAQNSLKKLRKDYQNKIINFSIIAFVILIGFELLVRVSSSTIFGSIVATVLAVAALLRFNKEKKLLISHQKRLAGDNSLRVERTNLEILFIVLLPMILVRISSLLLVSNSILGGFNQEKFLLGFLGCFILLLALYPHKDFFIGNCPRCNTWTSVALKHIGSCPACLQNNFIYCEEKDTAALEQKTQPQLSSDHPINNPLKKSSFNLRDFGSKLNLAASKLLAKGIRNNQLDK